jgi:predicted O-methyltransferase YrrM
LPANIREKYGLVYDISCDSQFFHDCGTFSIDATVSEEYLDELLEKLGKELSHLIKVKPLDDEIEHTQIAKLAFAEAGIAQGRFRLITNSVVDVISKLTDRAYDLVVLRHNPEDLSFVISEAHRILRSGGALVIDNYFGGGKVSDAAQRDPKTVALRDAGKIIKNDSEHWVSSLIPVGDGLLVATKV